MEARVTRTQNAIAAALVAAGVALRLLPHLANFAPVGAIALFGGATLSPGLAIALPLAVMVVSDLLIGLHGTVLFTWSGFVLVGLFGLLLRHKSNWVRVPLGAVGSALIFYIVSNFGVWVEGKLYAHTLQGLIDCFAAGLPFLKTSFLADITYSTVLFGAFALATRRLPQPVTVEAA